MQKEFHIAKVNIECEAESHRIMACYVRYMINRFKIRKYDHSLFLTCPRYYDYVFHINGLLLKARRNLFYRNKYFIYSSTGCKEIDILVKRFVMKRYKINLIYQGNYKAKKNILLKPFKLTFFLFLKDIIFDLKPKKHSSKDLDFKNNQNQEGCLIISHDPYNYTQPYINLSKRLEKHFKNKNIESKVILPQEFGVSIFDKFINLFLIIKQLIIKLGFPSIFSISHIHFVIFSSYNLIYKNKLKNYFFRNNINKIVCSIINNRYEPIFFEVAKELRIKYFTYDYSLGYPIKDMYYFRYLPDTRKYSNVIFSNSKFRTYQYKKSTKFLDKPPKILPHTCPQSDFSKRRKNLLNINESKIKIGIVDNVFADDCALNYRDINSLVRLLCNSKLNFSLILQSKRGLLDKEFKKYNYDYQYITSGIKGDFSELRNSDLILSLGWQSIALKAASFFKKPLLFYSKLENPYKEFIFSEDKVESNKISNYCDNLWLNEGNFESKLNKIIKDKETSLIIQKNSSEFLKLIGFYEDNLEDYFERYFK